uniref:Uncharacterized protein n=1 Tax=Syphacia muris TaxID=451379 RepID=A0A0N5AE75_9BILA
MDHYLTAIRAAANIEEVAKIVYNSIESPELYTFSELLAENLVKALADSPKNVEEEIKRIRKSMQEQEEESRAKEIRKPKVSRTQKFT